MEIAYREARIGIWEQLGRDRKRFEKKINEMSSVIAPVLGGAHRDKIFGERFHLPASSSIRGDNEHARCVVV